MHGPYSASKAAGDHLVRAWRHPYGLPVLMTNGSNNHDPYHFPEKLACGRVGETANVGGRNELPGYDRRYAIDARKIERGVG